MMNASAPEFCVFLEVLRISSPTKAITASAIATSIFNALTASAAIVGNMLMLFVFWNFKRLQTPSNLLLASLCVTDFITGAIVQPLTITRRLLEANGAHNCQVRAVCAYNAFLCIGVSIQSIAVVSIDRCVAIKMPFRYANIASVKRYFWIVFVYWILWAVFISMPFTNILDASQFFIGIAVLICIDIGVVLLCYGQIFAVVLSHRKRIHQQTPRQKHLGKGVDNRENNTNTIAIVILVMLICYLPLLPLLAFRGIAGDKVNVVYVLDAWADVFVYACSSVNPLIYWYRSKEIKNAVHSVLRRWKLLKSSNHSETSRRTRREEIPFSISYRKNDHGHMCEHENGRI